MITGANTNVRHEGFVYHVQTEQVGADNPELVTQVYLDGLILKTIRKRRDELSGAGMDDLRDHLLAQHRTVIQAVLRGRVSRPRAATDTPTERPGLVVTPLGNPRAGERASLLILLRRDPSFLPVPGADVRVLFGDGVCEPQPVHEDRTDAKGFHLAEVTLPDVAGEELALVVETSSVVGDAKAVLPVLPSLAAWSEDPEPVLRENPNLIVSDLGDPRAGEQASFMILVRGEKTCRPLQDAGVRLLFAEGEDAPRVIYEARTDSRGFHLAETVLPEVETPEASVIIEACSDLGTAETVIPILVP